MRLITFLFWMLLLSGCSEYSSYTKCVVVEEQKGASKLSAGEYCRKLVETEKIQCDSPWCSKKL